MVKNFKIKIFADGADIKSIKNYEKLKFIKGFTTNPTLMKKAGVKNYNKFAKDVLRLVKKKPVSFEEGIFNFNVELVKIINKFNKSKLFLYFSN